MKRVVSCSLFRSGRATGEFYADRLPILVRGHHLIWPEYELCIHHDDAITNHAYWPTMLRLQVSGLVRLIPCGEAPLALGALWRMMPIWDPLVELVVCRDIDSLTRETDRRCVEEFIASGKAVHTIHAHPCHSGLMAGLSAFWSAPFLSRCSWPTWRSMVEKNANREWGSYGQDEALLREGVLSKFADKTLLHLFAGQGLPPPVETRVLRDSFDAVHGHLGSVYDLSQARSIYDAVDSEVFRRIASCERVAL